MLSARSEESLRAFAGKLSAWLEDHANSNGSSPMLPELIYTLGARRNHHAHRLTTVARSIDEVIQELEGFAAEQASPKVRVVYAPRAVKARRGWVSS